MPNAVKIMVESVIRNTSLDINEDFDINKLKLWNDFDNSEEVPYFFGRFDRVAEIIVQNQVSEGRIRYKFYRDRGYPLQHHQLNQWEN